MYHVGSDTFYCTMSRVTLFLLFIFLSLSHREVFSERERERESPGERESGRERACAPLKGITNRLSGCNVRIRHGRLDQRKLTKRLSTRREKGKKEKSLIDA